jgi:hypothetical protein
MIMGSGYLLRSGFAGSGPYELEVTPDSAGWGYSSLKIISLSRRAVTASTPVVMS